MELKNGDFLRIRVSRQANSTEISLQGTRFQRLYQLDDIAMGVSDDRSDRALMS